MGWYKKYIYPKIIDANMASSFHDELRPQVIANAQGNVLELGAGSGLNFGYYKNINKLYALEPSLELIKIAQKRSLDIKFPLEFIATEAEDIPLANASVDTVVSTWTLCSVEKPERVLSEINRVLKTGGRFVFIDHGLSKKLFMRIIQHISTPVTKLFCGNCHLNRNIEKLVADTGFEMESLETFEETREPLAFNFSGIAKKTS